MRLPAQLLQRRNNSHKGDFGHIFVVAGSLGLTGAAYLTSEAAMHSGAGMVTLGIPESLNAVLEIKLTEVMTRPLAETDQQTLSTKAYSEIKKFSKHVDVLAIGPGLSSNRSTQALIRTLVMSIDKPMVVDADGLNALVGYLDDLKLQTQKMDAIRIVTPHPGEMARLLDTSIDFVQKQRENIARRFAKNCNVVVVLKGSNTVVASADGDIYVNTTGNPGMATAGAGDVLTGIIAAFLAQGLDGFKAAKFAVYIHGLAGDLAKRRNGELGLVASDIIQRLPEALLRTKR
jgi:NAD(P)H-hydrate epimerase